MEADRPLAPSLPSARARSLAGLDAGRGLLFVAAGLSFLGSVYLFFTGHQQQGIFVGLWVPSILSAGTLLVGGGRE